MHFDGSIADQLIFVLLFDFRFAMCRRIVLQNKWVRLLSRQAVNSIRRGIPLTLQEFHLRKSMPVVQPPDPYVLRVAVIGEPNAGKSTLVNKLSGWRVCSVSSKVHTTRENATAVLTEGNKQVVFVDTPGLITLQQGKRHHLEASLLTNPKESLMQTDLALVLVDVSNRWTRHRLARHALELLIENQPQVDTVLVLNKIDGIRSRHLLLDLIRLLSCNTVSLKQNAVENAQILHSHKSMEALFQQTEQNTTEAEKKSRESGWPHFNQVFCVSALTGEGVGELRTYLLEACKKGPWLHDPSTVTDQNPREMALMIVREKMLDSLPKEMPYLLNFAVEVWDVETSVGSLKMAVSVTCRKRCVVSHILGPRGNKVAAVVEAARQELANAFRCDVALKLLVKSSN